MSISLVDRSDDLARLASEGYDLEVRGANLVVHHVPYVDSAGRVGHCILVSELTTNGERTVLPGDHQVWVVGDVPHDHRGQRIPIISDESHYDLGGGLISSCRLSGKPGGRHPADYHEKISTYVTALGQYARALDPTVTHTNYPVRSSSPEESVFQYHDAATSRSGLSAVAKKLEVNKVAIVGVGGTGSYILDLVAKTPVGEIHLFDGDELLAHNAFRAPGAISIDDLRGSPKKADYFATVYTRIRRGLVPHPYYVDGQTIDELREMGFVFLSMDSGPTKKQIVERLCSWSIPFIDCGMGLSRVRNSLRGTVRVTTGLPDHYEHVAGRISFEDVAADEYDLNIQTADLNVLNAALAVIRWKKLYGYYYDSGIELHSNFVVSSSTLRHSEALVED